MATARVHERLARRLKLWDGVQRMARSEVRNDHIGSRRRLNNIECRIVVQVGSDSPSPPTRLRHTRSWASSVGPPVSDQ